MSREFLERFGLTPAECEIVMLAARDVPRAEIVARRGVKASTLKKQVSVILSKTHARSLDHLALRVVRAELHQLHDGINAPLRFDEPTDEDERELAAELGEPLEPEEIP